MFWIIVGVGFPARAFPARPTATGGGVSRAQSKINPSLPTCARILRINKYKLFFPYYSLSPLLDHNAPHHCGVGGGGGDSLASHSRVVLGAA